jgi:hypothetical protein
MKNLLKVDDNHIINSLFDQRHTRRENKRITVLSYNSINIKYSILHCNFSPSYQTRRLKTTFTITAISTLKYYRSIEHNQIN